MISTRSVTTEQSTVCGAFQATAAAFADQPAIRSMDGTVQWSWNEYAVRVQEAAGGLSALGLGAGDTMACWLSNRPEFHIADTAAMHLRAASFSVYPGSTVEQAEHFIRDSEARVLIAERATAERAHAVRVRGFTALETIIVVDDALSATMMSWAELLECASGDFDLERSRAAVQPTDLATLVYTSGTAGAPKSVELTHRNLVSQLMLMSRRLRLPSGISAISWLPMAHIAERLATHYVPMLHGWHVTSCDQPRAITSLVRERRPEFFFSPPPLWESLRAAILTGSDGVTPTGPAARDWLAQLGFDRLAVAIVGAAPCRPEVIEFWHSLGVPLNNVYGLSETAGVATAHPPDAIRIGCVGTPLEGVEVKLSPAGEVLIRGRVVTRGYRHPPDRTADAIDGEGWFHSGDAGAFDDDGSLRIVGRIGPMYRS